MIILGAGKLDKKIKLFEPSKTTDMGTHVTNYKLKYTVWANIRQITLRELIRNNVEMQAETYTIYLRYKSGITNNWRVQLPNGNYYRILSINTDTGTGTMILGVELDNSVTQEVAS
jgi:SPP1 family predicted phage head-tail adaptor